MMRVFVTDEDETYQSEICADCNGSGEGHYDGSTCSTCGGGGEVCIGPDGAKLERINEHEY